METRRGNPKASEIPRATVVRVLAPLLEVFRGMGLNAYVIGARSILLHGVDLGRETGGWDLALERPYDPGFRDDLTRALRQRGMSVQWRKWGFLVEAPGLHVDINYAPLILDEEFKARSRPLAPGLMLPSLEDIVVLKLMSGERKDLADVKRILRQKWGELDLEYLRSRASQAGLSKQLEKVLRRVRPG